MFLIRVNEKISILIIEDAVKKISDVRYGVHCMLIYPNLETFRQLYTRYVQKQIEIKNEILFNPFYETVGTVSRNLSLGHIYLDEF